MKRWWLCYRAAARYALIEQGRNRLALIILLFFLPLWIFLAYRIAPKNPIPFFLRPVGHPVMVPATAIAQISGGLQAIALIVGFMMFISTARSAAFDRRLVEAGYPRLALVLAKITALALAAVAVTVYTTAWMNLYWRPQQLALLASSLFLVALIYGGIGIMLAAVLRSELAAMFLLIMISFIDLGLQNPIANTESASSLLTVLPAYGAMQSAVTAVGQLFVPWGYLALGLAWAAGAAATGIMAFVLETRSLRTGITAWAGPSGAFG